MIEALQPVLGGIVSGCITALLGYAKSAGEMFSGTKALQTVIVGGIIGAVGGYYGMDYETAEQWMGSIGAITVINYVCKSIWRRIKGG